MKPGYLFNEAERLLKTDDEQALSVYLRVLDEEPQYAAVACFRIGEINNRLMNPTVSFEFHEQAFKVNPQFTKSLVNKDHPSFQYVYTKPDETYVDHCPLCGTKGFPYACYNTTTSLDFIHGFHPIRLWMCCDECHHLFAHNYPVRLGELLSNSAFEFNLNPHTQLFSRLSPTLMFISQIAKGPRLLEVGVGAGEFSAVAKEFLFDVTGLDIRPKYAEAVSKMLDIPVYTEDFQKFNSEEKFDVLVMGDVIEHMQDPVGALRKAHSLLSDQGVLWLSTPNFESAFSMVKKDADPMWRIVEHLNYFSFRSLSKWLNILGFDVVNYNVSGHYSGSMEVTAVKRQSD